MTGPNPTDRGKVGSKIHIICDRNGLPISVGISGANVHDSQALVPLVRGVPPIRSRYGPRRRRPAKLQADKGYDFDHLRGWTTEQLAHFQEQYPPMEHPVVRRHPETGRRSLFVHLAYTTHIVGMEPEESDRLLRYLFQQAHVPEYQVRFRWQPGDVAFWDNRTTAHYAALDYTPHTRVAERVAIAGDPPV